VSSRDWCGEAIAQVNLTASDSTTSSVTPSTHPGPSVIHAGVTAASAPALQRPASPQARVTNRHSHVMTSNLLFSTSGGRFEPNLVSHHYCDASVTGHVHVITVVCYFLQAVGAGPATTPGEARPAAPAQPHPASEPA